MGRSMPRARAGAVPEGEIMLPNPFQAKPTARLAAVTMADATAPSAEVPLADPAQRMAAAASEMDRLYRLPDRWLEMIDKESGKDTLPAGGVPVIGGRAVFPGLEEQMQASPGKP